MPTPDDAKIILAENVARGAAWLDTHHPGWAERVNPRRLEMGECNLCVVGQLTGEDEVDLWWRDRLAVLGVIPDEAAPYFQVNELGFDWDSDALMEGWPFSDNKTWLDEVRPYERLTDLWRDQIEERLTDGS